MVAKNPVTSSPRKLLLVVAALIQDRGGRVLLTQRPQNTHMAGFWEFPGGKVDPGETPEQALIREMAEETGLVVGDLEPWAFVSHAYPDFHLLMPVFRCGFWRGEAVALDVAGVGWFGVEEMHALSFPPADVPLINRLVAGMEKNI